MQTCPLIPNDFFYFLNDKTLYVEILWVTKISKMLKLRIQNAKIPPIVKTVIIDFKFQAFHFQAHIFINFFQPLFFVILCSFIKKALWNIFVRKVLKLLKAGRLLLTFLFIKIYVSP